MRFTQVFVLLAVAQSLAVGQAAPFGVRLGERLGDPVPALTAESLELFAPTNDLGVMGVNRLPSGPRRRFEEVELSRPIMGVSRTNVAMDQYGVGYEFTIRGSFRRGLAREVSLRKIEALRKDIERECGFKLNDYSFSSASRFSLLGRGGSPRKLSPDTVGGEGRGPELWSDLDRVEANSVTTHDGMRVSISCGVNMSSSNEADASGMDSPVEVTVGIILVDVLRKSEDRAAAAIRIVEDRLAMVKSARVSDFFGVTFGKPAPMPTNELTKTFYETWTSGDNGERKNYAKIHHWTKELKGAAIPFVDKVFVGFSLVSKMPGWVTGSGRIPKDVCAQEAMQRLDEFAIVMNKKYGMMIQRPPEFEDVTKDGHVQYQFYNDNVSLFMHIHRGDVDFELKDLAGEKIVSEEGWHAIPEKAKNAEDE